MIGTAGEAWLVVLGVLGVSVEIEVVEAADAAFAASILLFRSFRFFKSDKNFGVLKLIVSVLVDPADCLQAVVTALMAFETVVE